MHFITKKHLNKTLKKPSQSTFWKNFLNSTNRPRTSVNKNTRLTFINRCIFMGRWSFLCREKSNQPPHTSERYTPTLWNIFLRLGSSTCRTFSHLLQLYNTLSSISKSFSTTWAQYPELFEASTTNFAESISFQNANCNLNGGFPW